MLVLLGLPGPEAAVGKFSIPCLELVHVHLTVIVGILCCMLIQKLSV